jgi:hypothetical protein
MRVNPSSAQEKSKKLGVIPESVPTFTVRT